MANRGHGNEDIVSRRSFLVAVSAVVVGPACSGAAEDPKAALPAQSPGDRDAGGGAADALPPTPSCEETEDDPLGPYYSAGAPKRTTLIEPGMQGKRLVITGRVLSAGATCAGLAGAELDVWQANDAGDYDNAGYRLRGVFVADPAANYRLETIVPGRYLNGSSYRPRHIHVIVRAPGHAPLTTQLYFAGDPFNASDGMFKERLLITPGDDGAGGEVAKFDFFLR